MSRYVKLDGDLVNTVYYETDPALGPIERRFPASYLNSLMCVYNDTTVVQEGMYLKDGVFITAEEYQPGTPAPAPIPAQPVGTVADKLVALERDNDVLQAKLTAATQSNAMLEDCVVEMAGIVYV